MRILIAEDEKNLNEVLTKRLTAEKYAVDSCFNGAEVLENLECSVYDALVLDIMMPEVDGLEVLRSLRASGNKTPVLLLTARDGIADRVRGLDLGADDYLIKPFAFDELLARIRAMLRKSAGHTSNVFKAADLAVDTEKRTVMRGSIQIALTSKEFNILELLIRNKGRVLTRDRIINHIWNYDYEGASNMVDVYIRYLRKKLDDGYEPKLIYTIRGTGYVIKEEE